MRPRGTYKTEERIKLILDVLRSRKGYAPTLREICAETGISSYSLVGFYLNRMEEMGLISRQKKLHRGIILLESELKSDDRSTVIRFTG